MQIALFSLPSFWCLMDLINLPHSKHLGAYGEAFWSQGPQTSTWLLLFSIPFNIKLFTFLFLGKEYFSPYIHLSIYIYTQFLCIHNVYLLNIHYVYDITVYTYINICMSSESMCNITYICTLYIYIYREKSASLEICTYFYLWTLLDPKEMGSQTALGSWGLQTCIFLDKRCP